MHDRVFLMVTERCNGSCGFCQQNTWQNRGQSVCEAGVDFWIGIMDKIPEQSEVVIYGGEPLLHKAIRPILAHAALRFADLRLISNGKLLDRHLEFLVSMKFPQVRISIDGTPAVHDRLRGIQRCSEDVEGALRRLTRIRRSRALDAPRISINYTVSRHTFDDAEAFLRRYTDPELGISQIEFLHFTFTSEDALLAYRKRLAATLGVQSRCSFAVRLPTELVGRGGEIHSLLTRLCADYDSDDCRVLIYPDLSRAQTEAWYRGYFPIDGFAADNCGCLQNLVVLPNGTACICLDYPDITIGDLTESTLEDLKEYTLADLAVASLREGEFEVCYRCPTKFLHCLPDQKQAIT